MYIYYCPFKKTSLHVINQLYNTIFEDELSKCINCVIYNSVISFTDLISSKANFFNLYFFVTVYGNYLAIVPGSQNTKMEYSKNSYIVIGIGMHTLHLQGM